MVAVSLDPAADEGAILHEDNARLCRYCGFAIEERDQQCAALDAGRCEP